MITSPLRYPGGKAKLYDFFVALIDQNQLLGCHYCEPYAGGAGLALKLLSGGFIGSVALNDIDEAIWAFWVSALEANDDLCHRIREAKITIDEWHKQREIWRAKDLNDPLSLGFATFFLNRTNRSGIIEGAGPVGGYMQNGRWRLNARFDPQKQAEAVKSLAAFRSKISVSNLDAVKFIQNSLMIEKSLTYLDPPYYVKGSKLYRNSYSHEDHVSVKNLVSKHRDRPWVVSYDAVDSILDIYDEYNPILYNLSYSAGSISSGKEVIYLSDALDLPSVDGFSAAA